MPTVLHGEIEDAPSVSWPLRSQSAVWVNYPGHRHEPADEQHGERIEGCPPYGSARKRV